jgi:hypothetical protein
MERERRRRRFRLLLGIPILSALVLAVVVAVAFNSSETSANRGQTETLPPIAPASSAFLECTKCHGNLDLVFDQGRLPDLTFTHAKHFSIGVSDCAACHVANTHERDRINAPTMLQCYMCHGLGKDAVAPGSCVTCHPADMPGEPPSHFRSNWVPVEHAKVAEEQNMDCLTCHRQSFCDSCHGTTMPHASDWDRRHPTEYFADPSLCETCHPITEPATRDFCDSCHHPQGPDDVSWRKYHPTAVQEATATNCFKCHSEQTCTTCHRKGVLDLSADEQLLTTSTSPPSGG